MSIKIPAVLLISTFGLVNASLADDGPNIVIPANSTNTSCNGFFNPEIMSDPGVVSLVPVFTVNHYVCDAGTYLPPDAEECETCPNNKYCPGSDAEGYEYSISIAQGQFDCPDNIAFSPAGSANAGDCGRLFHVGDDSLYLSSTPQTSPALHIDLDGDGVADLFAPMTTADVPMSSNTTKRFKVKYNGVIYSVYDSTIDPDNY